MSTPSRPWERWHPIARSVGERLVARDTPDLTETELEEVKQDLARVFEKAELVNAVHDLLFLAAALEHEGAGAIAARLFALVENKPVLGALDRANHLRAVDRAEAVASTARRFAAFSRSTAGHAPAQGSARAGDRPLRVRDLRLLPLLA